MKDKKLVLKISAVCLIAIFTIPSLFSAYVYPKLDEDGRLYSWFVGGTYDPSTDTIEIYEDRVYDLAYQHELCHREQNYENRFERSFKNELECNIKQWAFWRY